MAGPPGVSCVWNQAGEALLGCSTHHLDPHLCELCIRHDLLCQRALALLLGEPSCRQQGQGTQGCFSERAASRRPQQTS